jgi:hypothetical protein
VTTTTASELTLTDDDRVWLARATIGRKPIMDWLAADPPADHVRAVLVKFLDRGGPRTVFARVLGSRLGDDPVRLYAENWPRKAARLAEEARARGDHPHAEALHAALVALMYCANCGRPLVDPQSIDRGIGPDCWLRIDPAWRRSISTRVSDQLALDADGMA